jgi:hypothetical protein
MHITGINLKSKNKKEMTSNQIIKNNMNKINEDSYRHTSYAKKIRPVFVDNDMGLLMENPKKDKYYLCSPSINNKINYKKINEIEYKNHFGNSENNSDNNKNIRSNSHNINDYYNANIKPIILNPDKYQKGNNNFNIYQTNHNIKFNNIFKTNNYGVINNKLNHTNINNNNNENNFLNLKNITLAKLENIKKKEEIKIKKPMPSLGHLQKDKNNNKLIEENNFVKQRRLIANDNIKRNSSLSEHQKLKSGNYKIELNVSNKNNTGKGNKIYNKNVDINGVQYNLVKNSKGKNNC